MDRLRKEDLKKEKELFENNSFSIGLDDWKKNFEKNFEKAKENYIKEKNSHPEELKYTYIQILEYYSKEVKIIDNQFLLKCFIRTILNLRWKDSTGFIILTPNEIEDIVILIQKDYLKNYSHFEENKLFQNELIILKISMEIVKNYVIKESYYVCE